MKKINIPFAFYIYLTILGLFLILFDLPSVPYFMLYMVIGLTLGNSIIIIFYREKFSLHSLLGGIFLVMGLILFYMASSELTGAIMNGDFSWFYLIHLLISFILLWESTRNKKNISTSKG
ncbi:hypothetical protein ATL39_3030 [Sinobaca qinghaiensis]|uniref:Uncharacterized protein n=1 Tax=Sinobaca qinghaiensis TaxID=342944 RepID=A0A419UWV8_9BACL|nr:hypothetical protein [Sinobaca qinghaiensis]RKD69606.1 hypothetical protein ATL39_3030 [Sinobaca qinghaiensis]